MTDTMSFCPNCDNLMYLRLKNEAATLEHYCRNCGQTNTIETPMTFRQDGVNTSFEPSNYINKHSVHDPALPRVLLECSSETCRNQRTETIYVRYDQLKLKNIFMCTVCQKQSYAK